LEPRTQNPEPQTDFLEALAWLDYCLEETAAAMEAVQDAVLEEIKSSMSPGWGPRPPGKVEPYHEICEVAAGIITLRGRARGWMRVCSGEVQMKFP